MENKQLLFTGASGFLGFNVRPILSDVYSIKTIGLTCDDDYIINLAESVPLLNNRFDIVIHAAGKAHSVPSSENERKLFFDVNLQGTKNLCVSLEKIGVPKSFIFISTVAVYGLDFGNEIHEDYPLNGTSPYALSKLQAEQFLIDWCGQHKVTLAILRPSLIAGPNPPGNLGAMIHGIKTGKYLRIGKGEARKSVLMVEDIARIILKSSERGGIYNVCDNHHPSLAELEDLITIQLNKVPLRSISFWGARGLALVGDIIGNKFPIDSIKLDKLTKTLTFSNEKAKRELNWEPIDVVQNFKIW